MFETYRMLGEQREADLLREAQRLHAAEAMRDGGVLRRTRRRIVVGFGRGAVALVVTIRMRFFSIPLVLATAVGTALFAFAPSSGGAANREARATVTQFFEAVNARRYEKVCALLSPQYFRQKGIKEPRICPLALRVGMMMSQEVDFRILRVRTRGDRATVEATANGVEGTIQLVRQGPHYLIAKLPS